MRVHEIAKKLGMESRLVIPELVRLGIQVTSHSNAVEDDAARWAMDVLQGKVEAPKGTPPVESVARNIKKTGGRLQKKVASGSGKTVADATISEPKKPEKKHILIKKKKTEEELAAEVNEFPSVKEESTETSALAAGASSSIFDTPIGGGPTIGVLPPEAQLETSDSVAAESGTPGVDESPIAVLPTDKPTDGEKKSEGRIDKKGPSSGRESPDEEKVKKPKKRATVKK